MLIELRNTSEPIRSPRRERGLWHEEKQNSLSIGCASCLDKNVCGGLQVERPLFDCLGFCCGSPASCDSVCRKNPLQFAQRVREVDGFKLDNVPRASVIAAPALPKVVPTLFHGKKRVAPFRASPTVCLPLYEVIGRQNGHPRYADRRRLVDGFKLSPDTQVILTGTAIDAPLERWWSLGGAERLEAVRALRNLGITLVTTPNFSLFTDRPRWDDLHSMKRIAIVHEEFLREGMPAALHVNARTDHDWGRWQDYIRARPEVTHIAFEFATGAGYGGRIQWHGHHLKELANAVNRPLHLVVRGGGRILPALAKAFSDITLLETSAFVKTIKRQRATLTAASALRWSKSPTGKNEPLDDLLAENWQVVAASYEGVFLDKPRKLKKAAG